MPDANLTKVLQGVFSFLQQLNEKTEDIRQTQFASKVVEGIQGKPSAMGSAEEGGRNARQYTKILAGETELPQPAPQRPATPGPTAPPSPSPPKPPPRKAVPLPETPVGWSVYGEAVPLGEEGEGPSVFAKPQRPGKRPPKPSEGSQREGDGTRADADEPSQTQPTKSRRARTPEFAPGDPLRKLFRKRPSKGSLSLDEPTPEEKWITAEGIAKPAPGGFGGRFPRAKPIPKAMPIAERIRRRPLAKRLTSPWDFLDEYEQEKRRGQEGPEFEPIPEEEQRAKRRWWERLGLGGGGKAAPPRQKPTNRRGKREPVEDVGEEGEQRQDRGRRKRGGMGTGQKPGPQEPPKEPAHRGLGEMLSKMLAPHFSRAMAGGGAAARLGGEIFHAAKGLPGGGGMLRGVGAILAGGGMGKGGALVGGVLGGGAGGAMGGAAAGAMAASAAFGPLAGLAAIATGLGAAFGKLRESALESNKALSLYSGALAIGQHGLERQQLIEQVRTARNTAGTGSAFLESEIARTRATQPLSEMGSHIANLGGLLKNSLENLLLETSGVNSLLRIANRYLAQMAGKGTESRLPYLDFIHTAAHNLWGPLHSGRGAAARGMASRQGAGRMSPGQGFGPGVPRGGGGGGFGEHAPMDQAGLAGGAAPLHQAPGHVPGRAPQGGFGGANMAPQAPAPANGDGGAEDQGGASDMDASLDLLDQAQGRGAQGRGGGHGRRPQPMTPQQRRQHQLDTARRRAGRGSPARTPLSTSGDDVDQVNASMDQSAEDAASGKNRVPGSNNFPGLPKLDGPPEA